MNKHENTNHREIELPLHANTVRWPRSEADQIIVALGLEAFKKMHPAPTKAQLIAEQEAIRKDMEAGFNDPYAYKQNMLRKAEAEKHRKEKIDGINIYNSIVRANQPTTIEEAEFRAPIKAEWNDTLTQDERFVAKQAQAIGAPVTKHVAEVVSLDAHRSGAADGQVTYSAHVGEL